MLRELLTRLGLTRSAPLGANYLDFFDPRDAATGFLSNFYRAPFRWQGFAWPTVEHFYQAHKCRDAGHQSHVRFVESPRQAKAVGRACKNLRPDWADWRMEVMLIALAAKFVQNPALQDRLLATGDQTLVETSPSDAFWGHGADGRGENRLGYLLTTLRGVLRSARDQGLTPDETALFSAVMYQHLDWWAFNQARSVAQEQLLTDGLGIMVRDTTLTDAQFNRYAPGMVLLEPGFLTGSGDSKAGLAAPVRFVLLAPGLRSMGALTPHPQARPCVCLPGQYWKVMGRSTVEDGPGLIALLQVPHDSAYLFDSLVFTDLEAAIYQSIKNEFLNALAAAPNSACQQPDWLEQVADPVGLMADGAFAEIWQNGMAQS
jgi:N-glycosidase YbiA